MEHDQNEILDNFRSRSHRRLHHRRIDRGLTAIKIAALATLVVACAMVLAGPLGDDITTSGTTSSVLLGFLLVTYLIGNTRGHMRGRTIPRQPK